MLIGILQAGKVADPLMPRFGEYPPMFQDLLGPAEATLQFRAYRTVEGEFPDRETDCDAWIVTGSKYGVYDKEPWIPQLKTFLQRARTTDRPMIGVCFGHQIMAEAFGGRAEKSEKGWGLGVHRYDVRTRPDWMADAPAEISMHAVHQDQVTAIPTDATVLATSGFCEFAALSYGDAARPDAISIQPHPEFDEVFARALTEYLSGYRAPVPVAEAALATFGEPVHAADWATWSARYLLTASSAACAA